MENAGRHFTEAARAAGLAKRREIALSAKGMMDPELFVVRCPFPSLPFGWETRRYGSIILSKSACGYETIAGARAAGELAMLHPDR